MPIYSYSCVECDTNADIIMSIKDRDNAMCEECGNKLIRGIDRPGMVWSPTRNSGYSF